MEIGLLSAFLGGALALLSPCGALLLPGFFASTVTTRAGLLLHGAVFYLGLVLTLVPLGVGAGALGTLFVAHRSALIAATSLVLIVLGAMHALGFGIDLARILPGADRAQQASLRGAGLPRTFLLGAVGGVAGFCAGPILGAVLTLAMGQGSIPLAAVLLAVYGAGMVVPLMVLAALWERVGPRARRVLRGRSFTVLGRTLHTTTVLTGAVIIAVGILFWATNGLVTMPSLIPTAVLARWQESTAALSGTGLQIIVILALGALALVLWWRADRRRRTQAGGRR
ncbi:MULTISPECIES: cytochrome c biogenesis CcdA family protein [Brachybacterium]|uniref:Cytochrome C biogenesis protein n=2 Tax=Brachybacterium TaxID=43668 RepID=A0A2A3YEK0_9MICO|nr:cytochrome c biogenesis CcdA family protein [Brachybacterium alimentarium]PCC33706.1 cytochrome C biogenesis protein [Brachybacterium alimentarium]PCC37679.1 cytochrome C biogenesis protein [Brachybacterium alimentarium]RCS75088.1 cytochrome c biogenesis protein CcdA [Brachybacterium alimentarium]RCS80154.1 cytochrome c biogenesis protein CcdA [Brachybacterium alimentarium]RCS82262.1 cytochrome c biogenesis protein CcdA [Brachybacterium alimentarium]